MKNQKKIIISAILITAFIFISTCYYEYERINSNDPKSDKFSSSNANLSSLSLSEGTLSPSFNENTTEYTAQVIYNTQTITVTATTSDSSASITANDTTIQSGIASDDINLTVGENSIEIIVTAEDNITTKTYNITVTKIAPLKNANLSNLVVSEGTLNPAFSADTSEYILHTRYAVLSITVTPTVDDSNATLSIDGEQATSGTASDSIDLNFGSDVNIIISVTAQDGTTTNNYTITARRVVKLPKTGQTTCYNAAGTEISCSGTGQDGDLQMGIAWPNPRFTFHGDGTATDNLTGLMWDDSPATSMVEWSDAINNANTLLINSIDDWRLPNINELRSLVHFGEISNSTWLTNEGFSNVQSSYYWSSSTPSANYARCVNIGGGWEFSWASGGALPDAEYWWGVRTTIGGLIKLPRTGQTTSYATGDDADLAMGITWPNPRFTDHGDGTITDNLTGLMWSKDANLPTAQANWQGALDYAAGMNSGTYQNFGYTDWRIPNVNELKSLKDVETDTPTLLDPFDNVQSIDYWTSTTYMGSTNSAWNVTVVGDGLVSSSVKTDPKYIWPVRGGQ